MSGRQRARRRLGTAAVRVRPVEAAAVRVGLIRKALCVGLAGTAVCVGLAGAGCGGGAPPPALQRLLPDAEPVSLGDETRLSSGDPTRLLLRRDVAVGDVLPARIALPAALSPADRVVIYTQVWQRDDRGRAGRPRGTEALDAPGRGRVVRVERVGRRAQVPLAGLAALASEPPLTLQVSALPLRASPVRVAADVVVPPGAVLAFGYGLRPESWEAGAPEVHFRVSAQPADGPPATLLERRLDPGEPEERRWHEARVDLEALAGRRVTLALEATWEGGADALALPVFADPEVFVPGAPAAHPNVLLVSVDTLRSRSLGSYGYARDTSPFTDALAREGTLFESAITTSVTTAPSHMSLFTGLYPVHHGLVSGIEWKAPGAETLAGRLRAAGYRTAAFTEDGFLIRRKGFGDGFSNYLENRKRPDRPRDVRLTFGQARRWLETNDREPFFLFVHTYQVHTPYEPRAPYAGLFRGDGTPAPGGPRARRLRDDYDREIRYVDDELRALFETLHEVGAGDRTIAVVTADHGEEFAEHGHYQHGGNVFEETLRVPLLLWGPGRVPAGRRIAAPVSLIDVAPTLLSMIGLSGGDSLDGVDLSGLVTGEAGLAPRMLFAEARSPLRWTGPRMAVRWTPPLVALRTGQTKFIVHRPPSGEAEPLQAFDLVADPTERRPREVSDAEARRVKALVDAYLAGRTRGDSAPRAAQEPDGFDPGVEAQLRDLGYVH